VRTTRTVALYRAYETKLRRLREVTNPY
jgi:hypothetical protein